MYDDDGFDISKYLDNESMKVYTLAITPYGNQNNKLETAKCSALELEIELSECYHLSKAGTPFPEILLSDSLKSSIKCLTVLQHAKQTS